MSTLSSIPRIIGSDLQDNIGKQVSIIGKIIKTTSSGFLIESSDNVTIEIQNENSNHNEDIIGSYVDIEGTVKDATKMVETNCQKFGKDFDNSLFGEFVKLSKNSKLNDIFNQ